MLDRDVVDVADDVCWTPGGCWTGLLLMFSDDVCFPPGVCMLTMTVADAADDVCWQQVDAEQGCCRCF